MKLDGDDEWRATSKEADNYIPKNCLDEMARIAKEVEDDWNARNPGMRLTDGVMMAMKSAFILGRMAEVTWKEEK